MSFMGGRAFIQRLIKKKAVKISKMITVKKLSSSEFSDVPRVAPLKMQNRQKAAKLLKTGCVFYLRQKLCSETPLKSCFGN